MRALLVLFLAISLPAIVVAQTVFRPFLPSNRNECESAWTRNNKTADQLVERLNSCNKQCTDRVVAGIGTSAYTSTCGGRVSYGEPGYGSFRQCAPLEVSLEKFQREKSKANDDCLAAVDRVSAAKYVVEHSENESAVPSQVSRTRSVTSSMRDRTTTGSSVTDRLRDESTNRAETSAASMMREGLEEIGSTTNDGARSIIERCKNKTGNERKRCLDN